MNRNLFAKYKETLAKIIESIEELELRGDLTENNASTLIRFTQRLNNETATHFEHSQVASDLLKAVDQVLSFSDVPDQISTRCEVLAKKFQEEFHNVSYYFSNLHSFKRPALEDLNNALINLKNHGQRNEVEPILKLVEVRFYHFDLFSNTEQLQKIISELMIKEIREKDPTTFTKEKYENMAKELQELRDHNEQLQIKLKKKKEKCQKLKQLNEKLTMKNTTMKEDFEYKEKSYLLEIEHRDKEIKRLRSMVYEGNLDQQETQLLKSKIAILNQQIAEGNERFVRLQDDYQFLLNETHRMKDA